MKEYLLLIRNLGDSKSTFLPERHQQFLKSCETYVERLTKAGQLISAQPLIREGAMISGTPGAWTEGLFSDTPEMQVGYYHILATDLDEAIAIAKGNPEFEYTSTARIEVRPIKMKEETTSYVYPNSK